MHLPSDRNASGFDPSFINFIFSATTGRSLSSLLLKQFTSPTSSAAHALKRSPSRLLLLPPQKSQPTPFNPINSSFSRSLPPQRSASLHCHVALLSLRSHILLLLIAVSAARHLLQKLTLTPVRPKACGSKGHTAIKREKEGGGVGRE